MKNAEAHVSSPGGDHAWSTGWVLLVGGCLGWFGYVYAKRQGAVSAETRQAENKRKADRLLREVDAAMANIKAALQ